VAGLGVHEAGIFTAQLTHRVVALVFLLAAVESESSTGRVASGVAVIAYSSPV